MRDYKQTRKKRYTGLSVVLVVTVLAAVVLLNVTVTALGNRFSWFTYLGKAVSYTLTDETEERLNEIFKKTDEARKANGEDPLAFSVIFCKSEDEVKEDSSLLYVYRLAVEIAEAFPDTVDVKCVNIWRNPTAVREYTDGGSVSIQDYSVIVDRGDRHMVLSYTDFFEVSSEDYASTKGFNGNGRFATVFSYLASGEAKLALLTSSHGESYSDYEINRLFADAGYSVGTIDLRTQAIPTECSLLLTYLPTSDLSDGTDATGVSEVVAVEEFLARGNSYLVCLCPDTPALPNLEAYLGTWGVGTESYDVTSVEGETEAYRYMVRNTSASLTADGYTLVGDLTDASRARELFGEISSVIFEDATALRPADGWSAQGENTYLSGARKLSVLYRSDTGSDAFAAGKQVSAAGKYPLMTLTEDSTTGAKVSVIASTDLLTGKYLQSAVYGNRQMMLTLCDAFDGGVVLGLSYSTWPSTAIESITTAQMRWITVLLTVLPAIAALLAGTVVLVKRKRG